MSRKEEEHELRSQKCDAKDKNPKKILEWVDFFQKNKPQVNCLVAGIMLLIYGGQNLGWGIFNDHLKVQPWAGGYEDDGAIFWTIFSWFISNILGLMVGSLIVSRYKKIKIYVLTSILSSTSAILFMVYPANISIIILARVIAGFSNGIVYLTMLIHASEISVPKLRGYNISLINLSTIIGVLIMSINLSEVYKTRSYEHDPTKILGCNGLICILSGLLLALFLNRESPVYLIKKYNEKEALNALMSLRSELHETLSIRQEFDELLHMVKEDSRCSMNILNYCYPFIVVLFLKSAFVCSFNMPLNIYFLEISKTHFYDGEVDQTGIYLVTARMIFMLISIFLIDFKRFKLFIFSCFGSCVILLYLSMNDVKDTSIYSVITSILFQIFAGIAMGNISDIYTVDSVNTKFKPFFILLTSAYETILQMILTVSYFYFNISISNLLIIFGIVMGIGILVYPLYSKLKILPDSSGLSLRHARSQFSK